MAESTAKSRARRPRRQHCAWLGLLLGLWPALVFASEELTIFAAASTSAALSEIASAYEAAAAAQGRSLRVLTVFAASSTLANQIVHGAPADLFLSASSEWMDHLATAGAIETDSRVDLLGNRLALIAPKEASFELRLASGAPLKAALEGGRLAIGDPGHVPAGRYGAAALENLGLWASVPDWLALAADVRGALALVERGEAAAGIVYRSDTVGRSDVVLVDLFPVESHPPITYPLAIVRGRATPPADDFAAHLQGEAAQAVFRRHGFSSGSGIP